MIAAYMTVFWLHCVDCSETSMVFKARSLISNFCAKEY